MPLPPGDPFFSPRPGAIQKESGQTSFARVSYQFSKFYDLCFMAGNIDLSPLDAGQQRVDSLVVFLADRQPYGEHSRRRHLS